MRAALFFSLGLLLCACGVGGGPSIGTIGDQTTLVDEPLLVDLGIPADGVEAEAYDPDQVLEMKPVVEADGGEAALHLIPRALTTGEAQITVTDRNGSAGSQSFHFRVVPPYRSPGQEFDLAADPGADDIHRASVALDGNTLVIGTPYSASEGVDDSGAVYVFEYDGTDWQQVQKLFAADLPEEQEFGMAVDVSGDLLIVGAPRDGEAASGAGAAYIFERDAGVWQQVTKLLPPAAAGSSQAFGRSVAIDGDYAVVGAPLGDSDGLTNNGQAYVYERANSISWVQQVILAPSDPASYDYFGERVAIDGTTAVAVIPGMFGMSPGRSFGAAYVFEADGAQWLQTARLTPIEPEAESFGSALAIEGNTVVVGASHRSIVERDGEFPGAIYVFARSNGEFDRVTKLVTGSTGADALGATLAFAGEYILAPVQVEDESHIYLYKLNQGQWARVNALSAQELGVTTFPGAIALSRDHAILNAQVGTETHFLYLPRIE